MYIYSGGLVAKSCPTLKTSWTDTCQASLSFTNSKKALSKKAMTNSVLKSRDITWPTKVHINKIMALPVVMNRYER